MNYESIIFDIDGTLWDSRALIAEGYNIQLRKEGLHHLHGRRQHIPGYPAQGADHLPQEQKRCHCRDRGQITPEHAW